MNDDAGVKIVEDCIGIRTMTSHKVEHIHNNSNQVKKFNDIPAHFVNEYSNYKDDAFFCATKCLMNSYIMNHPISNQCNFY